MRIRKRSIAVLSSSTASKTCTPNSTPHGDDEEERKEKAKKDFLFPLVVAVMDVQAKAEAEIQGNVSTKPVPGVSKIETGIHGRKRSTHNWRNALLRFDAENELVKIGAEDDKFNYRRNGIMRNAGDEFELKLPKSGRLGKTLKSKEEEDDLGLFTVERKTLDCTNCSQTVIQNDNPKRKSKAFISDKDDDNNHGGSRCRRRNGRGWRCSQRTLVGYSLCEHHLGKSRFTSINNNKDLVSATSKGSKFKKLHLVHAASCKVDI